MTFRDLPQNWRDLPVTGEILDDVLDLVVTEQSRHEGALFILLCAPDDRLMQPCQIDDLDDIPPELDAERAQVFEPFVRAVNGVGADCGLLVAIARRDGLSVTEDDLRWRAARAEACAGRARAIGLHVVTPHGSRRVPAVDAAA